MESSRDDIGARRRPIVPDLAIASTSVCSDLVCDEHKQTASYSYNMISIQWL